MPFPSSSFAQTGRFSAIRPIGSGASGQVYYAEDNLGRPVAIKEGLPHNQSVGSIRSKVEEESQLQAALQHPNIIAVYSLEEESEFEELYLICEYANGGSLADRLQRGGPLSEQQAIMVTLDMCAALEAIWSQQIVHRDIKPSNILLFVNERGRITSAKLGDFGIAQDRRARRTTALPGMSHPGTPLYMPPEQGNVSTLLDVRADIYALGITLWEELTGQDYKLLRAQDGGMPDLHRYRPDASAGMALVIARAIQDNPEQRYATPAQFAADLMALRDGKRLPSLERRRGRGKLHSPLVPAALTTSSIVLSIALASSGMVVRSPWLSGLAPTPSAVQVVVVPATAPRTVLPSASPTLPRSLAAGATASPTHTLPVPSPSQMASVLTPTAPLSLPSAGAVPPLAPPATVAPPALGRERPLELVSPAEDMAPQATPTLTLTFITATPLDSDDDNDSVRATPTGQSAKPWVDSTSVASTPEVPAQPTKTPDQSDYPPPNPDPTDEPGGGGNYPPPDPDPTDEPNGGGGGGGGNYPAPDDSSTAPEQPDSSSPDQPPSAPDTDDSSSSDDSSDSGSQPVAPN